MLVSRGHAVRGTTRNPARARDIEASGAEPFIADPDRVATLMPALDHVTVVCLLLGSSRGPPEALEALHGRRLEMLLRRLVDTTVRGVLYEARGSVPEEVLGAGRALVRRACEHSRLPFEMLETSPVAREAWLAAALGAVERLVS